MEYSIKIGLEIHIEMKTVSKMFSSAPISFNSEVNTKASLYDLGFPGTLPTVNKEAVIHAIKMAAMLDMKINNILQFDRKNYFYSDLPKGYQITQHFFPLGTLGEIKLTKHNLDKLVRIKELHIEEDTCKQVHLENYTLLDFNRAGVPLIEIVTEPDMHSALEARCFLEMIRNLSLELDISDGKMEEGSLRCDVNISVQEKDKESNNKVEIKNLNSISNVEKAIDYEIKRQISLLEKGEIVNQETRRFDENKKETVFMRNKESISYCYLVEPNIPPIYLDEKFINEIVESVKLQVGSRLNSYKELGLSDEYIDILLNDKEMLNYYEKLIQFEVDPKLAANWVIVEVQAVINRKNISFDEFNIVPEDLAKLISLIQEKKISHTQAKMIFEKMMETGKNPLIIIEEMGISLNSDKEYLFTIINKLLDQHPNLVIDYKNGKDRILGFFVGQIMKTTHGNVDPSLVSELLIQEIDRR